MTVDAGGAAVAAPTGAPAVLLDGVTFGYPGASAALRDIHLTIDRGEFVAVMGANGAGKTTLCLMLNGVIPNVIGGTLVGRIEIDGLPTTEHHVYELAERVGVVLQDPDAQILATDVVAEVAFAADNLGIPRPEMLGRVERALELVRLTSFAAKTPEELSGGQKQRLAIAAGLVMNPPIFVLDEPTAQLDPIGNVEVFDVLERLNREHGATIVIATHNSEDVARCADRVVVLDAGRIVVDGPPRDVFARLELLDEIGISVPEVVRIQLELGVSVGEIALDVPGTAALLDRRLAGGSIVLVPSDEGGGRDAPPADPQVPDAPAIVEVHDLRFTYPGETRPALDGIDLVIRRGEFLALVGQNGSGKTTLVKCLAGLLAPQGGSVAIGGRQVDRRMARELPRRIGMVLQNPDTQLFQMSVTKEIEFGLVNLGVAPPERETRIAAALELTDLGAAADTYPFKLSFGDRRKVAVAAIVAMGPEILVFDEPTTGQDYRGRYQLCEIARQLNERGTTVAMITHDMDLVARYAPRSVVLGLGRVLFDGPTRDAFTRPDMLRETFLHPPQAAQLAFALAGHGVRPDRLSVAEVVEALRPAPAASTSGSTGGMQDARP